MGICTTSIYLALPTGEHQPQGCRAEDHADAAEDDPGGRSPELAPPDFDAGCAVTVTGADGGWLAAVSSPLPAAGATRSPTPRTRS